MAKRRKRKASARNNAPKKRRRVRRNPGVAVARAAKKNPVKRRRSSYRRNPGIVADLTTGFVDGVSVSGGRLATRKLAAAAAAMLPAPEAGSTMEKVQAVGVRVASALAVGFAARRFAPKWARMITAGAFSDAVDCALAQTPAAPFLSAFARVRRPAALPMPARRVGTSAWPGNQLPRVSAWPQRLASPGLPVVVGN